MNTASAQDRDSLDIKIGQMILIGVPGTEVDPLVLKEIQDGKAGSIIFFEKNISSKNSFKKLRDMAWAYQHAAPIPLFISIDEEGGKVNRLKEKYGFPRSISAADMSVSIDSVRYYGETTAATLIGLGINVNFAPVVDVAINPNNPVITKNGRSFSPSEDSVTLYAKEFIKTHRELGVVTTLKHFPGHGSSKDDTHYGIADVTKTWEAKELTPYVSLIDSGYVDAIMTAHIVNKNLDSKSLPGTLSVQILDSLLRKSLKFNGVVFSDDMQMHAITKHYGFEEAIKLAVNAGVDILTFSNNIQGSEDRTVDRVHAIIKKFVANGTISESRINESFDRIMKLKRKMSSSQADYFRTEWLNAQQEVKMYKDKLKEAELKLIKIEQETIEKPEPKSKKKKQKN
ncbi:MAG: glycoside hydrolase family 3 N-terminal domain-containing protein [Cyclobacteriaceae bacterium]